MTSVLGAGEPDLDDVLALAKLAGLPANASKRIARDIQAACRSLLDKHGLV